ncbi:MAG: G1 family glutamic endopeptidase [Minisyncoccia bacterium]
MQSARIIALAAAVAAFCVASVAAAQTPSLKAGASYASANWAGYVASGATYTGIGGTWKVPEPQSDSSQLSADATWVGVGGSESKDLIQAGTQAVVEKGSVQYEAWYEGLPGVQKIIPLDVHGGDTVSVSLKETAHDIWQISFVDDTTGQQFQTIVQYDSSLSSAEWIEEALSTGGGGRDEQLPLDDFGTASFTGGWTIANGSYKTIAGADASALAMAGTNNLALATPTAIGEDGVSFSVARTGVSDVETPLQYAGIRYPRHRRTRRSSVIVAERFSFRW